jgi:serine phosphatase RsbU (regulator of sigma subunit)
VTAGGAIAVFAARARERNELAARRFALLSAIAEVADGPLSLVETAERLADILVPAVADQCTFDLMIGGEMHRLLVRMHGPDAAALERFMMTRPLPAAASGTGTTAAALDDRAHLVQADDALRRASARDERDLAGLMRLDARSIAVVPLRARGTVMGALLLVVSGLSRRRYTDDDLAFHEVLAGRAALALDNAGLDSDLRDAERQLGAALSGLDEAVTITDTDGTVLYANAATLALLGIDDATELYAEGPGSTLERFDVFDQSGDPVALGELPRNLIEAGAERAEPMLLRAVNRATGTETWLMHRASAILDDRGAVARVVTVVEDVSDIKHAELRAQLLAQASELLASSLDYERTLQQVVELAVPGLADWCGVVMPDERGLLRTVAVAHVDPAKVHLARRMAERYPEPEDATVGSAAVIRTGVAQWVNDIPDRLLAAAAQDAEHLELLRGLGVRSGLTVPMVTGGRVVGALSLISAESGRDFTASDVDLAGELARRAGTAVENARLFTERSRINAALQQGLLPPGLPAVPGWDAAAQYHPAGALSEVGGDFYDLFETPSGWMAVIGDVTGHGAQAARLTAVSRFALRAVAELTGDPLAAIGQLNRMLLTEPELSLVTVTCAVLGSVGADGSAPVDVIRCGHPAPLLLTTDGAHEVGSTNPIVGAFADAAWHPSRITIQPGETLLFYTDGVTDVAGAHDRFGAERLIACLPAEAGSASGVVRAVASALDAFRAGPQRDDEALLALRLARR